MSSSLISILIIGQSGQIAPVLTAYLCQNKSFTITTVSRLSCSSIESCQHYAIPSYTFELISNIIYITKPDCIIYCLAAGSVRARPDSLDTIKYINYILPTKIWSLCNRDLYDVKFFYFSSTAIYKGLRSRSQVNILSEPSPVCDYSYYKVILHENIIATADTSPNAYSYQLILASVFGGREHSSRLIPRIVSYLKYQTSFSLYLSHDIRDYISVFDICLAIENLVLSVYPTSKSSNILAASGVRYSNSEVFDFLKVLFDSHLVPTKILTLPAYYGDSLNYDSASFASVLCRKPLNLVNGFSREVLQFYSV